MPVRVGEGASLRFAGGILRHGDQAWHAAALFVLAADKIAWALRCNQHDVEIGARLNQLVQNVEPVSEQQRRALLQIRLDVFVELPLREIRPPGKRRAPRL